MANIKAYVIHRETLVRSSHNITARRSAQVARSVQVSALPFCPIASGNIVKLNVTLNHLRLLDGSSKSQTTCGTGAGSQFDLGLLLMLKTANNAAGKDISLGFTIAKRSTFQSLSS